MRESRPILLRDLLVTQEELHKLDEGLPAFPEWQSGDGEGRVPRPKEADDYPAGEERLGED